MSTQPSYTTHEGILGGYIQHDRLKSECNSLARTCTRLCAAGVFDVAQGYARQFAALDEERFEFLMALSDATRAFAAAVV